VVGCLQDPLEHIEGYRVLDKFTADVAALVDAAIDRRPLLV